MAFPTTSVIEAFTGTNGTSPPNANWTNIVNGIEIQSNTAQATTQDSPNVSAWDTATFGPDSEAYLTVSTLPKSGSGAGLFVRLTTLVDSTFDGYFCTAVVGDNEFAIARFDNGVPTYLDAAETYTLATGDSIGLEVIGSGTNNLKMYRKPSAGSWTYLFQRTEATYTSAGYIGLYTSCTEAKLDDFGGGTTVSVSIEQEGFRFRNDDGDEDGATWKASQDTNITLAADSAARIRVLLNATGDPASIGAQLEYRHKPSGGSFGSWLKVNS